MSFCHGRGSQGGTHCCYVDGEVCSQYWDRAAATDWINANLNGQRRTRALNFVANIDNLCRVAVLVLDADFSLVNNRAGFEAAWNSHPDYVANVRPAWAALEQRLGLPAGSFQCSTWKGEGGTQCCYAEDAATNEAKAATLHSTAVTVRRAGGT